MKKSDLLHRKLIHAPKIRFQQFTLPEELPGWYDKNSHHNLMFKKHLWVFIEIGGRRTVDCYPCFPAVLRALDKNRFHKQQFHL